MAKDEKPLSLSPAYRKFVKQRDEALQLLLKKTQLKTTDILRGTFTAFVQNALDAFDIFNAGRSSPSDLQDFERKCHAILQFVVPTISDLIRKLRLNAYLLSNSGETEAIGEAIKSKQKLNIKYEKTQEIKNLKLQAGGTIEQRIELYMKRLLNRMTDAVHTGLLSGLDRDQFLRKVYKVLPDKKQYPRDRNPKKVLKDVPITEAEGDESDPEIYSVGYLPKDLWDDLIQDYTEEYVSKWRGPENIIKVPAAKSDEEVEFYAWELERDITQDFVYSVRQGQVDAARENGINDFLWISILDDKTDECCVWRDGLTTSEIETKLSNEHKDDECQAVVPPAHFNCRCTLAPVTDDLPDKPDTLEKDFEEWLNQPTSE